MVGIGQNYSRWAEAGGRKILELEGDNMIFVARELVEKAWEHHSDLFVLFVDLKKAYDLMPCSALWRVLEGLGIPSTMISIINPLMKVCLLN